MRPSIAAVTYPIAGDAAERPADERPPVGEEQRHRVAPLAGGEHANEVADDRQRREDRNHDRQREQQPDGEERALSGLAGDRIRDGGDRRAHAYAHPSDRGMPVGPSSFDRE